MVWDKLVVEELANCSEVAVHVVVEKSGLRRRHCFACGVVDRNNEMNEVRENLAIPLACSGRTAPPETHKCDDHIDQADSTPLICLQLPVAGTAEVGRCRFHP